ncbi:HNH endonuclease [Streptomyces sp. ME19-01-6]|uniref:HNH endonuclease n=1 Tax=Streptomyces sp. ME19-01-6 TaxID=3028686 RepID=UPI0029AE2231|nr:HNH endonuclease [Streptomyces sp. ME19-01-6]MDX3229389.1 HNH endonuclease [Streptomyces sp. ME19-01-6]
MDAEKPTSKSEKRRMKRLKLAERDGARCFYCSKPADPESLTLDHWIPKSLWRCSKLANLRLACEACNHTKGNQIPFAVAIAMLRLVRENELWWRACMPRSAVVYQHKFERRHGHRVLWQTRPKCWPPRPLCTPAA